jgi:peptidoglycan/LPS O-acetylase OafA/YrhL
MSTEQRPYFPNLDFVRFLAAALVVMVHFFATGPLRGATGYPVAHGPIADFVSLGYVGVCLFFMISGFVISISAEKATPQRFLAARFTRIMPGFVICMTISAVALNLLGAPGAPGIAGWFANLTLLPQIFGHGFVDGVYWSLVYEVVFYGWIALFVWLGWFDKRLPLICWAWVAIAAADRLLFHSAVAERLFVTEFTGFFVIGLAIYLLERRNGGWNAIALLTAGVLLGVDGLSTFGIPYVDSVAVGDAPSLQVRVLCTITMLAIVTFALTAPQVKKAARTGVVLGGISYPLYLLHQDAGYAVLLRLRPQTLSPEAAGVVLAGVMALLAFMVFRFAENPLRRVLRPLSEAAADRLLQPMKKGAAKAAPLLDPL